MAGFNINNFRSEVLWDDLLRNNKFIFRTNIPTGLIGISSEKDSKYRGTLSRLEFFCETASQPTLNITGYYERKWGYGPRERRIAQTEYGENRITFYEDGSSENFGFFYDWLRLINNGVQYQYDQIGGTTQALTSSTNVEADAYEISYRQDYMVDAELFIYKNTGDLSRIIHYNELYPLSIEEAPVSWADNNSLLRLGVNFTYKEWYAITNPRLLQAYNDRPSLEAQSGRNQGGDGPPLPTKKPQSGGLPPLPTKNFPEPLG